MTVKRIIPIDEALASWHCNDLAKLAVIFNHDIAEDDSGMWRWKQNRFMCHFRGGQGPFYVGAYYRGDRTKTYRGSVDLNVLWFDLGHKTFAVEEMMKFYMQIGYSLCGFVEVWGEREASELDLPDAKPSQSIIDYMIEKYSGQVLKL